MNLSHLTLRRVTRDLSDLKGSRIQNASLATPNELFLDVARTGGGKTTRILISGSRTQSRICITDAPFPSKPDRPPWLDRFLLKASIQDIRILPTDRVIVLGLDKQDRVGSRYPSRLILECMGSDSNAIVVDPSDKIQGLLRTQTTEHRKLHPGAVYKYPLEQDRKVPSELSAEQFHKRLFEADTEVDALMTLCAGMDRHLAAELVYRSETSGLGLLETVQQFYAHPPFDETPGCVLGPNGLRAGAVAFKPGYLDDRRFEPTETISRAIELAYQDGLKGQEERGQKKGLVKTLKRASKAATTKRDRIEQDLQAARKSDELERMGSLILSQPQSIPAGATSVEVDDLFSDELSKITIALDPDLSAAENGQAFLKRSAKAKKSAPVLDRRLGQTQQTVKELERLRIELEAITEEPAVEAFRKKLESLGHVRPKQVKARPKNADPSGLHPRKYRTSDGWEVWVGRNDQENDRMTKSAPRNALWFHAHGCPGSHVVLRPRENRDPSPEAMHDAASLAAYWSKARGSKTVPVNYTEARHVQKPRAAPAGLVTIQKEKTLFVQPREIDKWDTSE